MLKVLDLKTKQERIVTEKAYNILKKRYKIIENLGGGNGDEEPKMQPLPNVVAQFQQPKVKVVEPVDDEIVDEFEEIKVNPSIEELTNETLPVKKKPGPKPKNVNA